MRSLRIFLTVLLTLWVPHSAALAGSNTRPATFDALIAALQRDEIGALVAGCIAANGDQGVLIFPIGSTFGYYFELRGRQTMGSGELDFDRGADRTRINGSSDQIERGSRVVRTLIKSYYFLLTAFDLGTIVTVRPRERCFENEP